MARRQVRPPVRSSRPNPPWRRACRRARRTLPPGVSCQCPARPRAARAGPVARRRQQAPARAPPSRRHDPRVRLARPGLLLRRRGRAPLSAPCARARAGEPQAPARARQALGASPATATAAGFPLRASGVRDSARSQDPGPSRSGPPDRTAARPPGGHNGTAPASADRAHAPAAGWRRPAARERRPARRVVPMPGRPRSGPRSRTGAARSGARSRLGRTLRSPRRSARHPARV